MRIRNLHEGSWPSNCFLLSSGSDALIIDPSVSADRVLSVLHDELLTLHAILLTHGHFDHILSLDRLRAETQAPALIHEADADFLTDPAKSCYLTMLGRTICHRPAERFVADGEQLRFGSLVLTVMHTPGHTGGSVCYRTGNRMFVGDTIFAEGYGRTDLPGGSAEVLLASLSALAALNRAEPGITIHPGHGGACDLGDALDNLPFSLS